MKNFPARGYLTAFSIQMIWKIAKVKLDVGAKTEKKSHFIGAPLSVAITAEQIIARLRLKFYNIINRLHIFATPTPLGFLQGRENNGTGKIEYSLSGRRDRPRWRRILMKS